LRQGGVEHASLVPAESGGWVLAVPAALLDPYIARLPCRDGLPLSLRTGAGIHLEAVLEVDVRDSVRSRGAARRRE
ncbi:MAG TPA: hypothetical protein VLM17_02550, partial [Xanthomonadaceae bacterium]|nr:hypothetical protein [Xanthomonadaceae bacterium]